MKSFVKLFEDHSYEERVLSIGDGPALQKLKRYGMEFKVIENHKTNVFIEGKINLRDTNLRDESLLSKYENAVEVTINYDGAIVLFLSMYYQDGKESQKSYKYYKTILGSIVDRFNVQEFLTSIFERILESIEEGNNGQERHPDQPYTLYLKPKEAAHLDNIDTRLSRHINDLW